jgi:hypothetical protein
MKQGRTQGAAICIGLALALSAVGGPAWAEVEVLESSVPGMAVGSKFADETRLKLPDGAALRVLVLTSGTTKTLTGPYEGTVGAYKEDRSWWERMTGREKEGDAPIGATRGIRKAD